MKSDFENSPEDISSEDLARYCIFNSLDYPVCVLGVDGMFIYGNRSFNTFFQQTEKDIRLDWEHPFFPEYRKRIAHAYISAIKGSDKQCFAILNTAEGKQLPLEIYLFPMFENGNVSSILVLMKLVDNRLLSFDRSTLSLISEDNFQYDSLHFEFSPMPIKSMLKECLLRSELKSSSQRLSTFYSFRLTVNR